MFKIAVLSLLVLAHQVFSLPVEEKVEVKRAGCADLTKNCDMLPKEKCGEQQWKAYCRKTCNACDECSDDHPDCGILKVYCNDEQIAGMCRKSCGKCGGGAGGGTKVCSDDRNDCSMWKDFCSFLPSVAAQCKKTCGGCGGGEGGANPEPAKPTPQPSQPGSKETPTGHGGGAKPAEKSGEPVLVKGTTKACLDVHNEYRAMHGVPTLVMEDTLTKASENYALELAKTGTFAHSNGAKTGKYGENIYYSASSKATDDPVELCRAAVKSWYDEVKLYDFNSPGFSGSTGHFTQVVWKSTKNLGMGIAKVYKDNEAIPMHYYYAVAQYTPGGNLLGAFRENVFPKTNKEN